MQIQQFVNLFKNKVDELVDSGIIVPSKRERYTPKEWLYDLGDWTFLFNCATFDLVKEHNQRNKTNLAICAEPEVNRTPTGRGGYSDLLICSADGNQEFIAIEHENSPHKRLSKTVAKLSNLKANAKLIITYYFDDYTEDQIVTDLKIYVKRYFHENEVLHLLIAKCDTDDGKDYEYLSIR